MIAARACPSSARGQFGLESRLFPVHPHHVPRAHDLTAIDVDGSALVDVVADLHMGAADDAFAGTGFIAAHVVDIAFVVQVCWRRFKIEPPCRLNFEPGLMANL